MYFEPVSNCFVKKFSIKRAFKRNSKRRKTSIGNNSVDFRKNIAYRNNVFLFTLLPIYIIFVVAIVQSCNAIQATRFEHKSNLLRHFEMDSSIQMKAYEASSEARSTTTVPALREQTEFPLSSTMIPSKATKDATKYSSKTASNTSEESFLKLPYVRISLIVIYSAVFFAILTGNIILIAALSTNRETLTPTNIFVLNLAFADLCVAIFCVYQNLSLYLLSEWIFSDLMCRMYHFVHVVSYTASVSIHVAIALERYLALVRPFWARVLLTPERLRTVIIAVWLLSALACLPRFLIYKTISANFYYYDNKEEKIDEKYETLCVISHQFYNPKIYDSCYIAFCFALPLVLIGILYTRICLHLWRSNEHTVLLSGRNYSSKNVKYSGTNRNKTPRMLSFSERTNSHEKCLHANGNEKKDSLLNKKYHENDDESECFPRTACKSSSNRSVIIELTDSNHKSTMSKIASPGYGQLEKMLAQRRQVIKLMISLVLSFALLSAPFHIRKLAQHFYPHYDVASNAATITTLATTLLLYFNSAMNPLLYICFSSRIRALMRRVVMNPYLICKRNDRFANHKTGQILRSRNNSAALQPDNVENENTSFKPFPTGTGRLASKNSQAEERAQLKSSSSN